MGVFGLRRGGLGMLCDKMHMFLMVLGNVGVGFGMLHDKMDVFLVVWGFDLEFGRI